MGDDMWPMGDPLQLAWRYDPQLNIPTADLHRVWSDSTDKIHVAEAVLRTAASSLHSSLTTQPPPLPAAMDAAPAAVQAPPLESLQQLSTAFVKLAELVLQWSVQSGRKTLEVDVAAGSSSPASPGVPPATPAAAGATTACGMLALDGSVSLTAADELQPLLRLQRIVRMGNMDGKAKPEAQSLPR